MSLPKPQFIANLVVEIGANPEFKKLETVVFETFSSKFPSYSKEAIWDFIEQYLSDIAKELFIKDTDNKKDGITINFEINEDSGNYYIRFFDKPEINLLRKLQADTPENFELFCKKILDKLGGNSTVSGSPNDGGIDFHSTDLLIANLPKLSTSGSQILVLGQAKRYKDGNHVKEKDLREFVGASIKRMGDLKKTRNEQFGILHPTILAFWTTSDFHSNAKEYAKALGIWYLSGVALCQLAVHLKVDE
jgi:restriction endonuclease Mrr